MKQTFNVLENGLAHTKRLSKKDANELLYRLKRFFPQNEYCIIDSLHSPY